MTDQDIRMMSQQQMSHQQVFQQQMQGLGGIGNLFPPLILSMLSSLGKPRPLLSTDQDLNEKYMKWFKERGWRHGVSMPRKSS